jgi:hypothetical protein
MYDGLATLGVHAQRRLLELHPGHQQRQVAAHRDQIVARERPTQPLDEAV